MKGTEHVVVMEKCWQGASSKQKEMGIIRCKDLNDINAFASLRDHHHRCRKWWSFQPRCFFLIILIVCSFTVLCIFPSTIYNDNEYLCHQKDVNFNSIHPFHSDPWNPWQTKVDVSSSLLWLRRSAEAGYGEAQRELALQELRQVPSNVESYEFWCGGQRVNLGYPKRIEEGMKVRMKIMKCA